VLFFAVLFFVALFFVAFLAAFFAAFFAGERFRTGSPWSWSCASPACSASKS
jgi:hypothetical protein